MNKIYKIEKNYDYRSLCELHNQGYKLICHRCDSELLVALNLEEAANLKINPGIYCPRDHNHVNIHIYLREMRERMRHALQGTKKSENQKK